MSTTWARNNTCNCRKTGKVEVGGGASRLRLGEEGVTSISREHFPYNENNLTNCSTQRNSPPIPHPPPPAPLHYHIKAPSSEQVFSFKNGSEAQRGRGRGQDRGSKSRPKTELAFIPLRACAFAWGAVCACQRVDRSECLLVEEKGKKILQKICADTSEDWSGLPWAALKSIRIPEAHNVACRGSDGRAEKCQSRYTEPIGGWYHVADGQHSTNPWSSDWHSQLKYATTVNLPTQPPFFRSVYRIKY